ncbi:MAG: glucokinase [Prochlorococcaceae cyanobacterium]
MTTLLAGDIGGTKTLLALYRLSAQPQPGASGSGLSLIRSSRYDSAAWDDLAPMVNHFLGEEGSPEVEAACFAVAGPVQEGSAQLTNLSWQLSESALARSCSIPAVELINDFAVLIYGLPHLSASQQAPIRSGQARAGEPHLVLGAGTGLGVAFGLPTSTGMVAVASEAAHGEFAPRSQAEWDLKQWLASDLGLERVSIERVVSGTGLGHVARWLLQRHQLQGNHPLDGRLEDELPAAVAAAAASGDQLACEALELWLGAYGSVCGDLALAGLSRGGLWLAGGTAAKLLGPLRSSTFSNALLNKGRLRAVLEAMPVTAVLDPAVGQFSAACRARMLLP